MLAAVLQVRLRTPALGPAPDVEPPPDPGSRAEAGAEGLLATLGQTLRLTPDEAEQIYSFKDDEPSLVVASGRLSGDKAGATREICLLAASARQLVGLEEWSGVDQLREVVKVYGAFDSSNFAAHVRSMEDVAVVRGHGRNREVKITRPGIESASRLIKSMLGEDGGR